MLENLINEKLVFKKKKDHNCLYSAVYHGKEIVLRLNNFPDEPAHTLIIDGKEIKNYDDLPENWRCEY